MPPTDPLDDATRAAFERRVRLRDECERKEDARHAMLALCQRHVVLWCNSWVETYDPRVRPAWRPFDLFPKQAAFLQWLNQRYENREEWVLEKSRDVGATWCCIVYAAHRWLFDPDFKAIFGANKADKVDRLGDPDSIFEKLRLLLHRLPPWMLPLGFVIERDCSYMKLINPVTGATITGESGDNMGRGGRASIYFIDEGAHVERADRVDAATDATSDCRGWVSSPNGMGNVFYRKRSAGHIPVFRLHYSDDPRKGGDWAVRKRLTTDPAIFAAEHDIDYTGSIANLAVPAAWIESARELGRRLVRDPLALGGPLPDQPALGGLDVGAGKAESCLVIRRGPRLLAPIAWREPDTTDTARRAMEACLEASVHKLLFDAVGVGAGVASTLRREARDDHQDPRRRLTCRPINVGVEPTGRIWPDGRSSRDTFANLKAEVWWLLRNAAKRSAEHLAALDGLDGGHYHELADLLILPDDDKLAMQLAIPKWFWNERGRIMIERKEQLAVRGVPSPDRADAAVLCWAGAAQGDWDADALVLGRPLAAQDPATGSPFAAEAVESRWEGAPW